MGCSQARYTAARTIYARVAVGNRRRHLVNGSRSRSRGVRRLHVASSVQLQRISRSAAASTRAAATADGKAHPGRAAAPRRRATTTLPPSVLHIDPALGGDTHRRRRPARLVKAGALHHELRAGHDLGAERHQHRPDTPAGAGTRKVGGGQVRARRAGPPAASPALATRPSAGRTPPRRPPGRAAGLSRRARRRSARRLPRTWPSASAAHPAVAGGGAARRPRSRWSRRRRPQRAISSPAPADEAPSGSCGRSATRSCRRRPPRRAPRCRRPAARTAPRTGGRRRRAPRPRPRSRRLPRKAPRRCPRPRRRAASGGRCRRGAQPSQPRPIAERRFGGGVCPTELVGSDQDADGGTLSRRRKETWQCASNTGLMATITTPPRRLQATERLWMRYLIADIEGDVERMRRIGRILDMHR